jgi:hypothetical protein
MKICAKLLFILISVLQINMFSQIPNSGFENWVGGDPSIPEGWITNNASPAYTPILRTENAYMGQYAVNLRMVYFGSLVVPPLMQSNAFPVSEYHGSVQGYYQFYPFEDTEVLYIAAWFWEGGQLVGAGAIDIGNQASTYTAFNFPIEYIRDSVVPDSAYIWMGIADTSVGGATQAAGYAYVDELSLGPPTGVEEISSIIPESLELKQNYPNPFNPSTKIEYSIPEASFVQLKVYDILGNEVSTLVNEEQSAGIYKADFGAENLSSGLYVTQLRAGKLIKTIKMTLLR